MAPQTTRWYACFLRCTDLPDLVLGTVPKMLYLRITRRHLRAISFRIPVWDRSMKLSGSRQLSCPLLRLLPALLSLMMLHSRHSHPRPRKASDQLSANAQARSDATRFTRLLAFSILISVLSTGRS